MKSYCLMEFWWIKVRLSLLFLLFSGVSFAYDFSSICSTGQTLYYRITDSINGYVSVTYPGPSIDSAYLNADMPIGTLTIPKIVENNGVFYDVTSVETGAFAKCTGLVGELVIPVSIVSLEPYAFLHCGNISIVRFNARNCTEAFGAFEGCRFDSLIIGNGVYEIPYGAFANSLYLRSLQFPESVLSIGDRAFYNCPLLESIALPTSLMRIGRYAFADCPSLRSISSINATEIGYGAFYNAPNIEYLEFGDAVLTIEAYSFFNMRNLRNVTIGANVRVINDLAFYNSSSIDTVFCYALNPPALVGNPFSDLSLESMLFVHCVAKDQYISSFGWDQFGIIKGYDEYELNVSSNDINCGYVQTPGVSFCDNEEVVIEAKPEESFVFLQWNDGVKSNPRTVVMHSDTSFIAYFVLDSTILSNGDNRFYEPFVMTFDEFIYVKLFSADRVRIHNLLGVCFYDEYLNDEKSYPVPINGVYFVSIGDSYRKKLIVCHH